MIVIDASALLDVLLRTDNALAIENRIFALGETLHAPYLLDVEIAQVLRRYCAAGDMTSNRGWQALSDLMDMSINRYPPVLFLSRMWELKGNITAYDAAYVSLAEALEAPLITRDIRLANAPGHTASIEVF